MRREAKKKWLAGIGMLLLGLLGLVLLTVQPWDLPAIMEKSSLSDTDPFAAQPIPSSVAPKTNAEKSAAIDPFAVSEENLTKSKSAADPFAPISDHESYRPDPFAPSSAESVYDPFNPTHDDRSAAKDPFAPNPPKGVADPFAPTPKEGNSPNQESAVADPFAPNPPKVVADPFAPF